MRIFTGLFTNLDLVIKDSGIPEFKDIEPVSPSKDIITRPGEILYVLKQNRDSEHLISREMFDFLRKNFKGNSKIGGNAANASLTLDEIGIPSVVSCPLRPESVMNLLGRYRGIQVAGKGDFLDPMNAKRKDPEYEHLSFEGKDHRKIFTFDPMSYTCMLDEYFWDKADFADILWLCGFHLVSEEHKKRTDLIADELLRIKAKVHLELGEGTDTMKYVVKKFIDTGVVDSLGMNELETRFIGFEGDPLGNTDFFSEFMNAGGLERLTVHSIKYRLTFFRKNADRNRKAAEYSVKVSAAKTLGRIKENLVRTSELGRYEMKIPRGKDFILVPAYANPRPKIITGIGDASSVADAVLALK